jgi:cytochrome c oxidase subunit III
MTHEAPQDAPLHEQPPHTAHEHPPHLAHHWETPAQQFEAGKLGMWLFLATEVLFFGGLFVAYAVWRGNNPDLFRYGSHYLSTTWGAINTAVLILSSMTMAMAVTYAQTNRRGALVTCLGLTLAGATTFMVIKYIEYSHKYHEGILPGPGFYEGPPNIAKSHYWVEGLPIVTQEQVLARAAAEAGPAVGTPGAPAEAVERGVPANGQAQPAAPAAPSPGAEVSAVRPPRESPRGMQPELAPKPRDVRGHVEHPPHPLQDPDRPVNAHMFFNIYFFMTGLHGIHVLAGMIVIAWLMIRSIRGEFSSEYFTPVDLGGLYWHLVDLIWIFLFPLFYLI